MCKESEGTEPGNDKKTADGIQNNAQKKNENNQDRVDKSDFGSECQPTKCNSKNSEHEQKHDIKWWFEIVGICFEVIGIGVAIWVAFLILDQYQEAVKSTKVFDGQLREMRQSRISDERAWIAISIPEAVVESNTVSFNVPFKNSGRTPAMNVVPWVNGYSDPKLIPPKDKFPNPVYSSLILPPDSPWKIPTRGLPNAIPYIKSGTYYLAGTIWYDDIFTNHHWIQFCYRIESDFIVTSPPIHHSCDDAENGQNN
jgi:hypothetical protein